MSRKLACLASVAALAACGLAAGSGRAEAAVLVGVADQSPAMFSQPLFTQLQVKRSRIFA